MEKNLIRTVEVSSSWLARSIMVPSAQMKRRNVRLRSFASTTSLHDDKKNTTTGESKRYGATNIHSEWRKVQMDRLEQKFTSSPDKAPSNDNNHHNDSHEAYPPPPQITSEDHLQPHWKQMETRVVNRIPRSINNNNGTTPPTGRRNIKKTDEEVWLEEGLYTKK